MILTGWGRYPRLQSRLSAPAAPAEVHRAITGAGGVIARGAGRAYGDAGIGSGATLSTERLRRMLAFDASTGRLTVESGVRLNEILHLFVARGFFPPVVPGTAHVTLGGMAAANVHGKNHHGAGGVGAHIEGLTLVGPDGRPRLCSPGENETLFRATIGGMGLTGVITDVTLRLKPIETAYIRQVTVVAASLDQVLTSFDTAMDATYSVAWIDSSATGKSLGRSLVYFGEHARLSDLPDALRGRPLAAPAGRSRRVPIDLPAGLLNPLSIKAFNELYFRRGRQGESLTLQPWGKYFFPLDVLEDWNRMYGPAGFLQHQCVIPKARGRDALGEILERVSSRTAASFLAVLKLMGEDEAGLMSFPLHGYTLALDFPTTDANLELLDELDAIVVAYGGRIYLAKDARQRRETLEAGYPDLSAFRAFRRDSGADVVFRSAMSERLSL